MSPLSVPTALNTYNNRNTHQASKPNTPHNTTTQTSGYKRAPFRKGIMCSNCGKEGHYGNECYKIVGYPPGHPLHGKFVPQSQRGAPNKRLVNAAMGNEETNEEQKTTSNNSTDTYVYCKMDQIQNQLNQMLLMMKNQGLQEFTAPNLPYMAGKYVFIGTFNSGFRQV